MKNNNLEKEAINEKINIFQNIYLSYAEKLKEKGAPLDEKGRVDMNLFQSVFGENIVLKDKVNIENKSKLFEDSSDFGELAELLVAIVFNKCVEDNLLVFRGSIYDDINNNVDIIIIDKRTMQPLGAIDVTSSLLSDVFKKKQKAVNNKNQRGGTTIKYGITHTQDSVQLSSLENVPLFILGVLVEEAIKKINISNSDKPTDDEKNLFNYFKIIINKQCEENKIMKIFN
jgi:hypothetical protein